MFSTFFRPYIVSKTTRLLFPLLYGLLIYLSIRLANDVISNTRFWERPWQSTAAELFWGGLINYLLAYTVWYLLQRNIEKSTGQPTTGETVRELVDIILILEVLTLATFLPLAALTDNGLQWQDVVYIGMIPLMFWLVYYLWKRGNALVRKSYEQQLQIEKISNDRLSTELQFLKAQYHPHFLFNALNTVYFQIDETNSSARGTVEKLAELLRYQLYDQQDDVSLKQELDYLKTYIDFQKERSSENLILEFKTKGNPDHLRIYSLLLVPLVENAFKYLGGDYRISIHAQIQSHQLKFEVMNSIPRREVMVSVGGIGLDHLKRRLDLLYPRNYDLKLEKSDNNFHALLTIAL